VSLQGNEKKVGVRGTCENCRGGVHNTVGFVIKKPEGQQSGQGRTGGVAITVKRASQKGKKQI